MSGESDGFVEDGFVADPPTPPAPAPPAPDDGFIEDGFVADAASSAQDSTPDLLRRPPEQGKGWQAWDADAQSRYARYDAAFTSAASMPGASRVVGTAKALGVHMDTVAKNMPAFDAAMEATRRDPAAFERDNPILADMLLEHPQLGSAIVQELEELNPLTKAWYSIVQGFKLGVTGAHTVKPGDAATVAKERGEQAQARTDINAEYAQRMAPEKVQYTDNAQARALREDSSATGSFKRYARRLEEASAQQEVADLQLDLAKAEVEMEAGGDAPLLEGEMRADKAARIEGRIHDLQLDSAPLQLGDKTGFPKLWKDASQGLTSSAMGYVEGAKVGGPAAVAGGLVGAAVGATAATVAFGPEMAMPGLYQGLRVGAGLWGPGFKLGQAWYTLRQEAGSAYGEFRSVTTEEGRKLQPSEALGAALVVGIINAGIESISDAQERKVAVALLTGNLRKLVSGNVRFRRRVAEVAKEWVKTGFTEGWTETLQSLVTEAGQYTATSLKDEKLQPLDLVGVVGKATKEGYAGAAAGMLMGGGTHIPAIVAHGVQSITQARTEATQEQVKALFDLAQVPAVQADPKAWAQKVADTNAVKGQSLEAVHIDPQALQERLLQEEGLTPEQADARLVELLGPDAPKDVTTALAAGTKLEVPMETFLGKWATTETGKALLKDVSVSAAELTPNEKSTQAKALEAAAQAMAAKLGEEQSDESNFSELIQTYQDNLNATGRFTPSQARDAVLQYRRIWEVAAERWNQARDKSRPAVTPWALAEGYHLKVGKGDERAVQKRQAGPSVTTAPSPAPGTPSAPGPQGEAPSATGQATAAPAGMERTDATPSVRVESDPGQAPHEAALEVAHRAAADGPADRLYSTADIRRGTESVAKWGLKHSSEDIAPVEPQKGAGVKKTIGRDVAPDDSDPDPTTRRIAAALEARQRELFGIIPRTFSSDTARQEAIEKIAKWMAEEVAFEYEPGRSKKSGAGWYSKKWQRAIDTFAREFPELKKDQDARNMFTLFMAVTSDGQKVYTNFKFAVQLYAGFRKTGKVEADFGSQRSASMTANFQRINEMLELFGQQKMHKELMKKNTVSELRRIAKKKKLNFKTEYEADVELPMAAVILGPKLGAFYANLMGARGYLTMDRWWSRTFNRYRGQLLPSPTKEGLARLRSLLSIPETATDTELLAAAKQASLGYEKRGFKPDFVDRADIPGKVSKKTGKVGPPKVGMGPIIRKLDQAKVDALIGAEARKKMLGKNGTQESGGIDPEERSKALGYPNVQAMFDHFEAERAAWTVVKAAYIELEDTPFNAKDRGFMLDTVGRAQEVLEARGIKVSVADIQAVLWYYEKRLYSELGARSSADVSYEEVATRVEEERLKGSDDRGIGPDLGDFQGPSVKGPDGALFDVPGVSDPGPVDDGAAGPRDAPPPGVAPADRVYQLDNTNPALRDVIEPVLQDQLLERGIGFDGEKPYDPSASMAKGWSYEVGRVQFNGDRVALFDPDGAFIRNVPLVDLLPAFAGRLSPELQADVAEYVKEAEAERTYNNYLLDGLPPEDLIGSLRPGDEVSIESDDAGVASDLFGTGVADMKLKVVAVGDSLQEPEAHLLDLTLSNGQATHANVIVDAGNLRVWPQGEGRGAPTPPVAKAPQSETRSPNDRGPLLQEDAPRTDAQNLARWQAYGPKESRLPKEVKPGDFIINPELGTQDAWREVEWVKPAGGPGTVTDLNFRTRYRPGASDWVTVKFKGWERPVDMPNAYPAPGPAANPVAQALRDMAGNPASVQVLPGASRPKPGEQWEPASSRPGLRLLQEDQAQALLSGAKWYSQAAKAVDAAKQDKGSGSSWWAVISKSPGVKAEELDLMGLQEWLTSQPSLTRKAVADYVRTHQVRVEEEVLKDAQRSGRASQLSLGSKKAAPAPVESGSEAQYINPKYMLPGPYKNARELLFYTPGYAEDFSAPHFTKSKRSLEKGLIAHTRVNERKLASGEDILFSEEVQADISELRRDGVVVPFAPFGDSWEELVVKRILQDAVLKGFAKVGWTTGAQQDARYAKDPLVEAKQGMQNAYDVRIPSAFRKLLKKYGGTVQQEELADGSVVWTATIPEAFAAKVREEGMALFQQEGNVPKGYADLEASSQVAGIFFNEKADFSTLVHEPAHIYLDLFRHLATRVDAPRAIRVDYALALEELGVPEGEDFVKGSPHWAKAHERWARSWEKYIAEGVAPSKRLEGAFGRMRAWILQVYQSVVRLDAAGARLTPELKRIFDNMLATDAEQKSYRDSQGPINLLQKATRDFAKAYNHLVTQEEWEASQRKEEDAIETGKRRLAMAVIKDELRRKTKEWKAAYKEAVASATKAYESSPGVRVREALEGFALDKAEVERVLGKDGAVRFAWTGVAVKEGGVRPGALAELLGLPDGDTLVASLATLQEKEVWVERQAEATMAATHPGLLERREELRRMVADNLAGFTEGVLLDNMAHLKRQDPSLQASPAEVLKRAAEVLVSRQKVRRLSPATALAQMRGAANLAQVATAKGEWAKADAANRKALVAHYTYLALNRAVVARDKLLSTATALAKSSARASLGKASPAYRDGADFLRAALGLPGPASVELDVESLKAAAAQLEASEVVGEGGPDWLEPILKALEAGVTDYRNLTVGQAQYVQDALTMLKASAANENEVMVGKRREEKEAVIAALLPEIASTLPEKPPLTQKGLQSRLERLGTVASALDGSMLTPIDMVRDLIGDNQQSTLWQAVVAPLRESKHAEADLMKATVAPIVALFEQMPKSMREAWNDAYDGRAAFPGHIKNFVPRKHFERIMLALNAGNESSLRVLTEGRGITIEELHATLQDLTKEEIAWINAVWKATESLRGPAFDLEERLTGLRPQGVKAVPILLKEGRLEGGYFPLQAIKEGSAAGQKKAGGDEALLFDPAYTRPTTAHGHLKARTGATYPVSLDPSGLIRHLASVTHDTTHREAVKSVAALVMDERIRMALQDRLGAPKTEEFLKWLKSIGGGDAVAGEGGVHEILSWAKGNMATALLSGLSTAVGNFANIPTAIPSTKLKTRHLSAALGAVAANYNEQRAQALALSGSLRAMDNDLVQGFNRNLEAATKGKWNQRANWLKEMGTAAMKAIDNFASTAIWLGAHRQALEDGKVGADAVAWADDLVLQVQPSASPVERAGILRDKKGIASLITFYGYLSVAYRAQHNIAAPLRTQAFEAATPAQKMVLAARVSGQMLGFYVAYAVLGELLMGRGPEDGDKDKDEPEDELLKWRNWFIRKMVTAPLTLIPLVPASSIVNSAMVGKPVISKSDPISGLLEQTWKSGEAWKKWAMDEGDLSKALAESRRAGGLITGMPTRFGDTTLLYLWDITAGDREVNGPGQFASGIIYGEKDKQPDNLLYRQSAP